MLPGTPSGAAPLTEASEWLAFTPRPTTRCSAIHGSGVESRFERLLNSAQIATAIEQQIDKLRPTRTEADRQLN